MLTLMLNIRMSRTAQWRHTGTIAIAVLTALFVSCAESGDYVRSTSAYDQQVAGENSRIKIYSSESPPDDYTVVELITVKHNNKNERQRIARVEAAKRGGDALIAKPEKRETSSDVRQSVDFRQKGGFAIKTIRKVIITQDFLIISHRRQESKNAFAKTIDQVPSGPTEPAVSRMPPRRPPERKVSSSRFRDNRDGTVYQIGKDLTWQKCSAGQTYEGESCSGKTNNLDALDGEYYCQNLDLANKKWRLPTREEMELLIDTSSPEDGRAVTYRDVFPSTPADIYWTNSVYDSNDGIARYVIDFSDGTSYAYYIEKPANTRCVAVQE